MKSDYFQTADNLSMSGAGCERPLLLWPHTNVLIAARNYVGTRTIGLELYFLLQFGKLSVYFLRGQVLYVQKRRWDLFDVAIFVYTLPFAD